MEENKEITFGRILKVAFSNWKIFVPVAAVVALSAAVGIHFGYNTLKGKYSSTFSYSSADLAQDKYADGSDFFYKNLVSYTNLSAVKASDEKYKSIDVDAIVDKNAISITTPEEGEKTYTITLSYRYIKNQDLAKSFIKDIAESALKKDAAIVNDGSYDASLKLYEAADTFEDKVMYLNAQAQYLSRQYKTLSASNSDDTNQTQAKSDVKLPTSVVEQITANQQQLDLLIPSSYVASMNSRISKYGLSMNYNSAYVDKLVNEDKAYLNAELTDNENRINELTAAINAMGSSGAISEYKTIEALVLRNEDIKLEISKINYIDANNRNKDPNTFDDHKIFVRDLTATYNGLNNAISAYRNVLKAAYIDNASVEYEDSSVIKLNGTIGIAINALISVAVGVVIGAAVNLIVDRKKLYE